MTAIAIRHAWLQKHPTPAHAGGAFHWFPVRGDAELRARFVERAAGLDAPALLWRLAPGQVAWAQLFAATAPTDGRRYTGMTLSIAEHANAPSHELLAALDVPVVAPLVDEPRIAAAEPARRAALPRLARALIAGQTIAMRAPAATPRDLAALDRAMPRMVRTAVREGALREGPEDPRTRRDLPGELLAAASTSQPAASATRAWALLSELHAATGRTLDALCIELEILWADGALTAQERAQLAHSGDFASLLHAWGRGRLDGSPTADTLPERLADAVALRALARLLDGDDPARAIAEARWHALLPADRRADLVCALVRRTPSLLPLLSGAIGGRLHA